METLITIIDFLILGLIIISPIILLIVLEKTNIKYSNIYYFFIGLFISGGLIYFFAWWTDKSSFILLEHYGYKIYGINETESYKNVLPQNIERVKELKNSIMGISWVLKAIFGFIIFIPYLLIIYVANKFWQKFRQSQAGARL